MPPRRKPSPIVRSSRAERAAWTPHDFVRLGDQPVMGRDVPVKPGPDGYPVPAWECRIQAYGEYGLRRETKCSHCGRWLSYRMCPACQARFRLTGRNDTTCDCLAQSLYVYASCDDHRLFEQGHLSPS